MIRGLSNERAYTSVLARLAGPDVSSLRSLPVVVKDSYESALNRCA